MELLWQLVRSSPTLRTLRLRSWCGARDASPSDCVAGCHPSCRRSRRPVVTKLCTNMDWMSENVALVAHSPAASHYVTHQHFFSGLTSADMRGLAEILASKMTTLTTLGEAALSTV